MIKKFVSMFLALVMCLSLAAPAFAVEEDFDDGWIYIETIVFSDSEENIITPYVDNFTSEIIVLESSWDTVYTVPSGQRSGGYNFPTGGGVYVNTSGGEKIKVELSAAWIIKGTFSISLNVGVVSDSVGGYFVNIPADDNYYRIEVKHEYLLEHVRVAIFNNGVLVDVQEGTRVASDRISARPVKV